MSAPNMQRWKQFERDVANHLTDRLGIEVVTTRNIQGGRQLGHDLATTDDLDVLGWKLELKTTKDGSHHVTPWCRQARQQSDGAPWAVVAKVPYASVGDATVYTDCLGALVGGLGDAIRWLSLDLFVDLLKVGDADG